MRRIVIVVVVVIILACIAVSVLFAPMMSPRGQSQANLQKTVVDKGDIQLTVDAIGSVVANRQSSLSFEQPGQVIEVLVTEGQTVEAGQLLARLDDSTQQSKVKQAEYNLQAAETALNKILQPIDADTIAKAEANVKSAQANYSSIASSVSPQQVTTAELQVQKAEANLESASILRARAGGRFGTEDPNYLKSVAAEGQAWADAEIARLNLEKLKRGRSVAEATANIAYQQSLLAQIKVGPKQIDIDTSQNSYIAARLQLEQAKHELDKTQLVAPFAGVVSTINVKQGEISQGVAIILTDLSQLYVDVNVDEVDIGKIQVGQTVEITLDALGDTLITGKVQRIAATANINAAVVTYPVRVVLDSAASPLKVGMTANVTFLVRQVDNVIRIPNQYLRINRSTGQVTVNLVNADGSLTEIPIVIGLQSTDYSEVVGGLQPDETVALVLNNAAIGFGNQ